MSGNGISQSKPWELSFNSRSNQGKDKAHRPKNGLTSQIVYDIVMQLTWDFYTWTIELAGHFRPSPYGLYSSTFLLPLDPAHNKPHWKFQGLRSSDARHKGQLHQRRSQRPSSPLADKVKVKVKVQGKKYNTSNWTFWWTNVIEYVEKIYIPSTANNLRHTLLFNLDEYQIY